MRITREFRALRPTTWSLGASESARPLRVPVVDKENIRKILFEEFRKCLYPLQRFESDPEGRFAVVLEVDATVKKWVKPAKGNFQVHFRGGELCEPDFVMETQDSPCLAEVKARGQMDDGVVLAKARAVVVWCHHATQHTLTTDGKPWRYVLSRTTRPPKRGPSRGWSPNGRGSGGRALRRNAMNRAPTKGGPARTGQVVRAADREHRCPKAISLACIRGVAPRRHPAASRQSHTRYSGDPARRVPSMVTVAVSPRSSVPSTGGPGWKRGSGHQPLGSITTSVSK